MQPALASMLAQAMIDDRIEQAEHFRRGRQASGQQEEAYESVTDRRSRRPRRFAAARAAARRLVPHS